jgi:hypothetical protein
MDVSVSVSLEGGHTFDFICDEGDPVVAGLVSALPGASVDANLPADGLIQVRARSGERTFLTRQSLVAVSINQLGRTEAPLGKPRRGALTPEPFVILPNCLSEAVIADLQAAADAATKIPITPGVDEIELSFLPSAASACFAVAIAEARSALSLATEEHSHLDIKLHGIAEDAQPLPVEIADHAFLMFAMILPLDKGTGLLAIATLPDRVECDPELTPLEESRAVTLTPNSLFAFGASAGRPPVTLRRQGSRAAALLVTGSLWNGPGG